MSTAPDFHAIYHQPLDLVEINARMESLPAQDILRWALNLGLRTIVTSTFGDHSAALLHMATRLDPDIKVLWVDTGYNTSATYRFAEKLISQLHLNISVYTPQMTSARRNVLMKGIPDVGEPLHAEFTRQVKLEPFQRAIHDLQPEVWITGVRRDQTDFRKGLDFVTRTNEGILKIAPLLKWTEADLDQYLDIHNLPNEPDYFDPTKAVENRECGLHTSF